MDFATKFCAFGAHFGLIQSLNIFFGEIIVMKINFEQWKKDLLQNQKAYDIAYRQMQEKIANQTDLDLHTMLLKGDFENFLSTHNDEVADLTDQKMYEKELENFARD
jgi:hypothetical protein